MSSGFISENPIEISSNEIDDELFDEIEDNPFDKIEETKENIEQNNHSRKTKKQNGCFFFDKQRGCMDSEIKNNYQQYVENFNKINKNK